MSAAFISCDRYVASLCPGKDPPWWGLKLPSGEMAIERASVMYFCPELESACRSAVTTGICQECFNIPPKIGTLKAWSMNRILTGCGKRVSI